MNTVLKYAGITLSILIGLILLLIVLLKLIPDSQYKSWIASAVQSSTGRDFSMETLELDFGTSLRVGADTIQLANADWADTPEMLTVNRLEAELKLLPLLSGKAEIITRLDTADIISQSNEDGLANWALGTDETSQNDTQEPTRDEQQGSGLPIRPILREVRIDMLTVSVIDDDPSASKTATLKHLLIETPDVETSLSIEAEAGGTPILLSGSLGDINGALDLLSTPLHIDGKLGENQLKISGEWGPIMPEPNLNLLLDILVPSTSSLAAIAGLSIEDLGELEFSARARAIEGLYSIEDIETKLDGELTRSSVNGEVGDLLLMDGVDIGVDINSESLHRLVSALNIELPVPIPPEIQLNAQIQGGKDGLGIHDISIIVQDEGVDVNLTGSVNDVLGMRQLEAKFNATVDNLSSLSKYANLDLPALGAIALSGNLRSEDKAITLQALDLGLSADNLKLIVTGGVGDLITVNGIDAQISADIDSLTPQNISEITALLKTFGVDLPVEMLPQSLKLNTGLQGNLETLSLNDIEADVLDEGIKITLVGAIENVLTPSGIAANMTLDSDSIASFSKYAGTDLPDLGPLEATAHVVSSGESFSLKSLEANLASDIAQAEVTASVTDLLATGGIQADITAHTTSLALLSDIAQTELPDTDPVKVHATLSGKDLEQAKLTVTAQSAGAELVINSLLSQLKAANKLQMDVSVKAENLGNFDKFAQMELPDQGPLDLSTTITIEPGAYTLDSLKLNLAEQSATGNMVLKLPEDGNEQDVTLLHGELDIPYLDLSPFLANEALALEQADTPVTVAPPVETDEITADESELAEEEIDTSTPLDESDRLLSSEPILFELLRDYDIDLNVKGARLGLGKADLEDLHLNVLLKDGLLNIAPIDGIGSEGGTINGSFQVDGKTENAALVADIKIHDLPMPNLGGTFDFNLDINGQGQSVAALMASLNGQILVVARDGVIPKSIATRFGTGLMSSSGDKDNTNLECLIVRVDVVDGVADFKNKIAAQLTEVTWRGGGTVDFNTERLHADIAPKPRKGIPISVGGSLAGLVKLTGTLKNPKVAPDYSDAAFKYGKYSAYIATGGLSLLAEIIANKITSNQDVCEKILDGTVFAAADKSEKKNLPK